MPTSRPDRSDLPARVDAGVRARRVALGRASRGVRAGAVAAVAGLVLLGCSVAPTASGDHTAQAGEPLAAAAAAVDPGTPAGAAAAWLRTQATDGVYLAAGAPDWGLTSDVALAHVAAGLGPTAGAEVTDRIAARAGEYVSPLGGANRSAGPLAKLLLLAVVSGRDVSSFGGFDLRGDLLDLMVDDALDPERGRFRSSGEPDASNGFGQAYGVIGLARSGGVPAAAVSYLLAQQCPAGGVRLFYSVGPSCTLDTQADTDTTALTLQALEAVRAPGAVIGELPDGIDAAAADALAWLLARQDPSGGFGGTGPTALVNANTTALAAQALRAAGATSQAAAAVAWLRAQQVDCEDVAPGLVADRGAVAYSPSVRDATVAAGKVPNMYRDQYRRSTAQAILAFAAPSFAVLGDGEPAASAAWTCPSDATTTTAPPTTAPASSTTAAVTTSAPVTTTGPARTSATVEDRTPIVAGITQTASGSSRSSSSRSTGSGSGSGSATLAVTGASPAGPAALGAGAVAVGALLLALARRRMSAP